MQERSVKITIEAIYDIVNTEEYIARTFGEKRAAEYRRDIRNEISSLSVTATIYASSGFMYRNYVIYKKPFPPGVIFWVVREDGAHVLRVPREEYDWKRYFETHRYYEYSYPETDVE